MHIKMQKDQNIQDNLEEEQCWRMFTTKYKDIL